MTVVILQSNYIPWRGYFDLIHDADLFVFDDDLQYTHHDWRNRNRIVTPAGSVWLTIPAGRDLGRRICDVEITDQSWKRKHKQLIQHNYARAPGFKQYRPLLDFLYDNDVTNLSAYNQRAIRHITDLLGLKTAFADTLPLNVTGRKTERIVEIMHKVGGTTYLSGPRGSNYIDETRLAQAGISLRYKQYPEYPVYPQSGPAFDPSVSILDLLFNVGDQAPDYIWGGGPSTS
jgi:hypothetical protein